MIMAFLASLFGVGAKIVHEDVKKRRADAYVQSLFDKRERLGYPPSGLYIGMIRINSFTETYQPKTFGYNVGGQWYDVVEIKDTRAMIERHKKMRSLYPDIYH